MCGRDPMSQVDTSRWTAVGSTSAYAYYAVTPDLLALIPFEGARETAKTARENLDWQDAYWRKMGHTGSIAVFVDRVVDQDAEARAVYADPSKRALTHGAVLIGGTFWGRAAGKAFLAVKKQPIPVRLFASLEEAMPWIEEVNRIHRRTLDLDEHGE
jgi:hypothetical protein